MNSVMITNPNSGWSFPVKVIDSMDATNPECFITKQKDRLKQHGKNVYLKNKDNFELELYNPRKSKVLAKIKINGKYISDVGIIINPGQRVHLERFLDTNNKFLFETYEVDNTEEVKKATQNNGLVDVEFYYELSEIYLKPNYTRWYYHDWNNPVYGDNTQYFFNNTNTGKPNFDNSTSVRAVSDSLNFLSASIAPTSVETGRVEKGEVSNQSFTVGSGEFSVWVNKFVSWKILPESTKPITVTEQKNYCTECGFRIRKSSWKYCPKCSNEL